MNKDIKVKDSKQKLKDACPAQTEADSLLQPKITTSCPACSNTFVVGSFIYKLRCQICCLRHHQLCTK